MSCLGQLGLGQGQGHIYPLDTGGLKDMPVRYTISSWLVYVFGVFGVFGVHRVYRVYRTTAMLFSSPLQGVQGTQQYTARWNVSRSPRMLHSYTQSMCSVYFYSLTYVVRYSQVKPYS